MHIVGEFHTDTRYFSYIDSTVEFAGNAPHSVHLHATGPVPMSVWVTLKDIAPILFAEWAR